MFLLRDPLDTSLIQEVQECLLQYGVKMEMFSLILMM